MGALPMRPPAALLLLAAAVLADDGGIAPDTRWSHARGPASCSAQSFADPPETFGGFAWTYKSKSVIRHPPVVWDDAIFLVEGDGKSGDLVVLDAETGKSWAHTSLRSPGEPALASRSAFLVEEGKTLVQFQLDGRALQRGWTYDVGAGASPPRIVDGEIYVATSAALLSLRAGLSRPVWKVDGAFAGEPAVRGVETLDVDTVTVRLLVRTPPGRQFEVAGELRRRIAEALRRAGMTTAGPVVPGPDQEADDR